MLSITTAAEGTVPSVSTSVSLKDDHNRWTKYKWKINNTSDYKVAVLGATDSQEIQNSRLQSTKELLGECLL